MKLVAFPVTTGLLVLATWLAVTAVEQCVLANADPKFSCGPSLQFVFAFGSIAAVLSAIAAALARVLLLRRVTFRSVAPELSAASLTSVLLVLLFAGIIYWEIGFGGIAGNFIAWLVFSFMVSAVSLFTVKHVLKKV